MFRLYRSTTLVLRAVTGWLAFAAGPGALATDSLLGLERTSRDRNQDRDTIFGGTRAV